MLNDLLTTDVTKAAGARRSNEARSGKFYLASVFIVIYSFCATTFFGALLFDLIVLYPNVFADIPASLELTSEYLTVANPGTLFPRVGQATLLSGIIAVAFNWRMSKARNILLFSLAILFGGTYLITELFFNRRNEILFLEGVAQHSVEELQAVSREFLLVNWLRVAVVFIAPWLAQTALLISHESAIHRTLAVQANPVHVDGDVRA